MRLNECSCGCGKTGECNDDLSNYMFTANLHTIKRAVDTLLEMDQDSIDRVLTNGHDWASDHIATAKDDLQEVSEFFINELGRESSVRMMGSDSRLADNIAIKTFESFLNEGKKKKDNDEDGDTDFADAKIAQYIAGGMSKADAIKKSRKFNKSVKEGFWNRWTKPSLDQASDDSVKSHGHSHRGNDNLATPEGEYIMFNGQKFKHEQLEYADINDLDIIPRIEDGMLIIANPNWNN